MIKQMDYFLFNQSNQAKKGDNMEQRFLLAAKSLTTGRILDVSSCDKNGMLIQKDHVPSEAEIEFAESEFGSEKFEFFVYEE